jgi:hypothetical protein
MGSNNSGKQVLLKKIVTGSRISVSSQYKKDNHCLPTRTQLPNKCYPGSLTIVANDTSPHVNVSVSRLTCVGNDYSYKI